LFAIASVAYASPKDQDVVTYYDRDRDGVADCEVHQVRGAVSLSYVLWDLKFKGRYDRKSSLAYPYNSERVDIPVPRHVKLIPGMPPTFADQRFKSPDAERRWQ
jgi:hypothetical protein